MKKLWIYANTGWSFGALHRGLAAALRTRGWTVALSHYAGSWAEFDSLCDTYREYDCIMTLPDGNAQALRERAKIPIDKTFLVGHAEIDLIEYSKHSTFDGYGGYAVVSDMLACSSMTLGISRIPIVLPIGIDQKLYDAPVPTSLTAIGYGSIMMRALAASSVDGKRGNLAKEIAEALGCKFTLAYTGTPDVQGRILTQAEMIAYYHSVDCVIMPSLQEGSSMPPLEATAAGRIVLATPVGHVPQLALEGIVEVGPLNDRAFVRWAIERLTYLQKNPIFLAAKCATHKSALVTARDWGVTAGAWESFFLGQNDATSITSALSGASQVTFTDR